MLDPAVAAVAFAVLAVVVHPILWGAAASSSSSIVATTPHLRRFRRALRAFEAEVLEATAGGTSAGSSVSA